MKRYIIMTLICVIVMWCSTVAGCGPLIKNGADDLTSISIAPHNTVNLIIVDPQDPPQVTFNAVGRYESGMELDRTYSVLWICENPDIADFDGNVLTAKQSGSTRVRAREWIIYSPWTTVEIAVP